MVLPPLQAQLPFRSTDLGLSLLSQDLRASSIEARSSTEARFPEATGFSTLFSRLVANTAEPDNAQACWTWLGKCSRRYPATNIRYQGRHITIKPHRAMLVLMELEDRVDLFWDLYELYSIAQLEADHLCFNNPLCINPDHLQWLTAKENSDKRHGK